MRKRLALLVGLYKTLYSLYIANNSLDRIQLPDIQAGPTQFTGATSSVSFSYQQYHTYPPPPYFLAQYTTYTRYTQTIELIQIPQH